jgi:hypothetical protein
VNNDCNKKMAMIYWNQKGKTMIKINQKVIFCLVLFICLVFISCQEEKLSTFQDVLDGKIPLGAEEAKAIQAILAQTTIQANDFGVVSEAHPKPAKGGYKYSSKHIEIKNGHISILIFWNQNITDISDLSTLSHLQVIQLRWNKVKEISGLAEQKQLIKVDLMGNQLSGEITLNLSPSVEELDLSSNKISTINDLSQLKNLKRLFLNYNQIKSLETFKFPSALKSLLLRNNQIQTTANINNMPNLEHLGLRHNPITEVAGLNGLEKLATITFENTKITSLDRFFTMPALKSLDLKGTKFDGAPQDIKEIKKWLGTKDMDPVQTYIHEIKSRNPDFPITDKIPDTWNQIHQKGTYKKTVQKGFGEYWRFSSKLENLTGVAGWRPPRPRHRTLPYRGCFYIKFWVASGKLKVYLKECASFTYNEKTKELKEGPPMAYRYIIVSPEKPDQIVGRLLAKKESRFPIILEALDGESVTGIQFIISTRSIK